MIITADVLIQNTSIWKQADIYSDRPCNVNILWVADVQRIAKALPRTVSPDQNQKLSMYLGLICSALPMFSWIWSCYLGETHKTIILFKHSENLSHLEMMISVKGILKNTFTVGTYLWWYKLEKYHKPVVFNFFVPELQFCLASCCVRPCSSYFKPILFFTPLCCFKEEKTSPHIRICKRSFTVSQSNSKWWG